MPNTAARRATRQSPSSPPTRARRKTAKSGAAAEVVTQQAQREHRMHMVLDHDTRESADWLREELQLSYSDVTRHSLRFLRWFVANRKEGFQLVMIRGRQTRAVELLI